MRSRSSRGSISSIYSPVNEASVTVARSEPEPLTHSIRAGRPRKSTSSALAEVLPPPQLHTERSAPSLRERATSCASVVGMETCVIASNPLLVYFQRSLYQLYRCVTSCIKREIFLGRLLFSKRPLVYAPGKLKQLLH